MCETSSTRIRRRTCHSQITTYDEFDRKGRLRSCLLQLHQTRGGPRMDIKILKKPVLDDKIGANLRTVTTRLFTKRIMVNLGLLKSGKVELRSTIDQGNLRKLLGISCNKLVPHRGEPLLGGNAHSARYGEMIHDGSGNPLETLNHQEEANSENFVMGSDEAEFVDKVKDQVRNRQKRMSNVAESGEEHSIIWGMFMAATLNAATFMERISQLFKVLSKNFEESLSR